MKFKKYRNILIHLIGCIAFLSLPLLFSPRSLHSWADFSNPFLRKEYFNFVLLLAFFYLNFYVFIPKLYLRKQYLAFFMVMVACFLFISTLPHLMMSELRPMPPGPHERPRESVFFEMGHMFFHFVAVAFVSLTIKISDQLKLSQKKKLSAELAYLKAQINPHFLFNSLNAIYSMALEKSDEAPDAILKLSGLMRYVITDAHNEKVQVEDEVNYICDYIDLQKMRLGNTIELMFIKKGNFTQNQIAPLLLIPFVENAFKYGVSPGKKSDIYILISIDHNILALKVRNSKLNNSANMEMKTGIGIKATVDRLIILYPGDYNLDIEDLDKVYNIELKIKLQ